MKILIIAPHITNEHHPQFMKNLTGLGRIINDMASYIGKKEKVDVFTLSAMTPTMYLDGFKIIGRSWRKVLCGISSKSLGIFIDYAKKYGISWKWSIRLLYYCLSLGQVAKIIKNYDIVHLHGCSPITYGMIKICEKHHTPILITLHGLISFGGEQTSNEGLQRLERDLLLQTYKNRISLNFISSGNKKIACDYLQVKDVKNYYVISNGCDVTPQENIEDIRKNYRLKDTDFVIAYVANISDNKNQRQIVEAFTLLDESVRQNIKILFVGRDGKKIMHEINEKGLQNCLFVCGGVPRKNVGSYYKASNATILTSHSEGFGLSIIEGYVYGKPCLTFSDMPAVKDLYHQNAMLTMPDRKNQTLAKGIISLTKRQWNENWIKNYAKNFSAENMANNYINLYRSIIYEHKIQQRI